MSRADRNRLAVFERRQNGARNELNEPVEAWPELFREWASRSDIKDGERVAAGFEAGAVVARFEIDRVQMAEDLTPADRLQCDGHTWNIIGVKEAGGGYRKALEITAQASVNDGN